MKIEYTSEKVDSRRSKRYARLVVVNLFGTRAEFSGVYVDALADALRAKLEGHAKVRAQYNYDLRGCDDRHLAVSVEFSASKPSAILDKEAAIAFVRQFEEVLQQSVAAQQEVYEAAQRAEHDARQATRLASWAGTSAAKSAREITRYDQRLAALDAELAAETKVQVDRLLATSQIEDGAQKAPDEFSPRAIATARAHVSRYAKPVLPGLLGLDHKDLTATDLVEPAGCPDCDHDAAAHSADAGCSRCGCSRCRGSIAAQEPAA